MSTQTPQDAAARFVSPRSDFRRRRREVALTQRWLRQLRAKTGATPAGEARPTARFTRPVEH